MRRLSLALGAAVLVFSTAVTGHEGATGVVMQRMDDMKVMGRSLKRIGDRLRSKGALAAIAPEAEAIAAAAARMPGLFPAGSRDAHTEATAAVWTRRSEFDASSRSLAEASRALAAAARSGDAGAVSAQFRVVARSCTECHDVFRERR